MISIKSTQIGLDVDDTEFRENLGALVSHARTNSIYTWVDMEDSSTTETTLDAVTRVSSECGQHVGVCLQANLKRTPEDIERISDSDAGLRLVKGAYDGPESFAYQSKDRIDEAFRDCIRLVFAEMENRLAIATHDEGMIQHAKELDEHYGTDVEFQLLMGVRPELQRELAVRYPVWQYAPYGEQWLSYFYRRIRERKENALFAARAVLDQVR